MHDAMEATSSGNVSINNLKAPELCGVPKATLKDR